MPEEILKETGQKGAEKLKARRVLNIKGDNIVLWHYCLVSIIIRILCLGVTFNKVCLVSSDFKILTTMKDLTF